MSAGVEKIDNHSGELEYYDTDANAKWYQKLNEFFKYRFLLKNLVIRDVKVRYKNSFLGFFWSLLNPLLMMIVYTLLFTVLIPNNNIRMFPVFILVALIPWNFLGGSLMNGTTSVTGNSSLIKKVYFPRLLLPSSSILAELVNFLLAFVVLIFVLYVSGIGLTIYALWVPVIVVTQIVFMLGLVLILGTLQVFYRDVMMILNVVLLAWFFLTPIFYPFEQLGESATIWGITFSPAVVMRWLNPMASIIDGYRTVLWGTLESSGPVNMDPAYLIRTFATAVIVLIVGYVTFYRFEHLFGEKL